MPKDDLVSAKTTKEENVVDLELDKRTLDEKKKTAEAAKLKDIEALSALEKRRRDLLKRESHYDQNRKDAIKDGDKEEVEEIISILEDKWSEIERVSREILRYTPISKYDDETANLDDLRESFIRKRTQTLRFLRPSQSERTTSSSPGPAASSATRRLPQLELKKFKGKPQEWSSWWGAFEASVHSSNLPAIEKFSYLQLYTEDAASAAIAGLALTDTNYDAAVTLLKNRFGRNDIIQASHVSSLMRLPDVEKRSDVKALRALYDSVMAHIRSMDGMGIYSATYATFLKPILLGKIPIDLAVDWNKTTGSERANLETFMHFIQQEVESRELALLLKRDIRLDKPSGCSIPSKPSGIPSVSQLVSRSSAKHSKSKQRSKDYKCVFCNQPHFAVSCSISLERKLQQVAAEVRCVCCLSKGHSTDQCRNRRPCRSCGEAHHTALCQKWVPSTPTPADTTPKPAGSIATTAKVNPVVQACAQLYGQVFLKTATILVEGRNGPRRAICLVDGGSQRSFIRRGFAEELDLQVVGEEELSIHSFGSKNPSKTQRCKRRCATIRGTFYGAESIRIQALDQTDICKAAAYTQTSFANTLWNQGLRLADDRILSGCPDEPQIDILIGSDQYWDIIGVRQINSGDGMKAVDSKLGWMLHGPCRPTQSSQNQVVVSMLIHSNSISSFTGPSEQLLDQHEKESGRLHQTSIDTSTDTIPSEIDQSATDCFDLKAFWSLENLGIMGDATKEPDLLMDYESKISRNADGRYRVALPWKQDKERLLPNRSLAEQRLRHLLKKLENTPDVRDAYHRQIQEYLADGFIREADSTFQGAHNYLPHRPVIRSDKTTTKIRPVFDGSAKTRHGPSINDCLEVGPNLNPDLLAVLLRFRMHKTAWIADIEKAFLQIELDGDDAEAVRFLWVDDPSKPNCSVKAYTWKRVTFGLTSSPFILKAVLNKHLKLYLDVYPETVQYITDQLYVDDQLGGACSLQDATKTIEETIFIFAAAKMNLRKWLTNDEQLQLHFNGINQFQQLDGALGEAMSSIESAKVLGLRWDPLNDTLLFNPDDIILAVRNLEKRPTKRQILQISSRIFDPLGHLAPIILLVKMIYQHLWEEKVSWDEPVSEAAEKKWRAFISGLDQLQQLRIPRFIRCTEKTETAELHVFGDASELAYGAVAYLRSISSNRELIIHLLCSKTRVAPLPLRSVSLPRLELLGSLLAATLADYIVRALRSIQLTVNMWTDSRVALGWIRGDIDRWKPFVRNRVASIQNLTSPHSWRHCPGLDNPADLASRGAPANQLINSSLWWNGPTWLAEDVTKWPASCFDYSEEESTGQVINSESKSKTIVGFVNITEPAVLWDISRIDTFRRLVRITAWIQRFIRNLRTRPVPDQTDTTTPISITGNRNHLVACLAAEEITDAELIWFRHIQYDKFPDAFKILSTGQTLPAKHQLAVLRPLWDPDKKLIRVTGRIELSLADRNELPPILLPANQPVADLIIVEAHCRVFHAGLRSTLSELRDHYWIVRCRQQVKRVLHGCLICRRHHSRPFDQVPAVLPLDRIREANPFEVTGVDFAGPVYIHDTQKQWQKVYICLFTCAVTRAVHLELVPNLLTPTFILTLRKFFARRGTSSVIYSDNAKTFKKADRYLQALKQDRNVSDYLTGQKIEWRFSPGLAPWWGGWWERMVRTTKEMLRKTIGRSTLTFLQLETVLLEIEATVNSRPLTYMTDGDGEPQALTPSHLVSGRRILSRPSKPPPAILTDSAGRGALISRESRQRKLISTFWQRWRTEYLFDLRRFNAPGRSRRPIRLGELVLIHDANAKRLLWTTGVVTNLIHGKDGLVRSVLLRTPNGNTISRPIQRLYPLEIQSTDDDAAVDTDTDVPDTTPNTNDNDLGTSDQEPPASVSARENVGIPRITNRGRMVRLPQCYLV